jgi:hypothetical protein
MEIYMFTTWNYTCVHTWIYSVTWTVKAVSSPCHTEPSRAGPGRGVPITTQSCGKHLAAALPWWRLNSPKLLRNWPLLGNCSVNTLFQLLEDCSLYGLCRGYITTVPYRTIQSRSELVSSEFSEWVRGVGYEHREKVLEWSTEEYRRSDCEEVKCDSTPIQEVRLEDVRRNTCSDWSASFCIEIRCYETTSGDWESECVRNGELKWV